MLQERVDTNVEEAAWLAGSRYSLFDDQQDDTQTLVARNEFDCEKYPDFCKPPFNCQYVEMGNNIMFDVVAKNNHLNFQTFCYAPQYYDYMTTCIQKKDLVAAAQIQFDRSTREENKGVDELDGSYCFIEGHCSNEAVTENTTVEEAEEMCDARYGHADWAKFSMTKSPRAAMSLALGPLTHSRKNGFKDRKITRMFLKLACAMGNYHCDVMYCKETYCKKEYYVEKYKHLLPETPGHKLRQRYGPVF